MHKIIKLLSLVAALLLAAASSKASVSYEQAYLDSYRGRTDVPVPISVVVPSVGFLAERTRVEVKFQVDEKGSVRNITIPAFVDKDLAEALTSAVAKWKFNPLVKNGKTVAKTVALPFDVR